MDDYRVATNLTLNLGIRYEYFTPWSEEYGHIANLEIAPGFSAVTPVCAVAYGSCAGPQGYPAALIGADKNNFGPRTGLAWKPWPKGKLLVRVGYGWYYNPSQYNKFMQELGAEPPFAVVNTATTVLNSPTQELTLATGLMNTSGKSVTNSYAVPENYLNSYAQTWNILVQRDLPGRWVGELAYLGTKGTRLDIQEAPNQAPLGSALTAEQRLPIAYAGNFIFVDPVGNSIYNAAQVRLTRRFQRGISTNIFYTFSKSIDDIALAQNFYDQAAERGLSANDRRHVVTANWVLASPVDATQRIFIASGISRQGAEGLDAFGKLDGGNRHSSDRDRPRRSRRHSVGRAALRRMRRDCRSIPGRATSIWRRFPFRRRALTAMRAATPSRDPE